MDYSERIDIAERFAHMWKQSREDAGKSQEYMAKALRVSRKTVQNWETGVSSPSQTAAFEWFEALGIAPMPYYLEILYPGMTHGSDADVTEALSMIISGLTPELQKKLLYILAGGHGSSVAAVIDMITAHLQSPLRDRLNIAQSIYTNYEMADAAGAVRQPDEAQPNMELLNNAIQAGKAAVKDGRFDYTLIKGDKL